MRIFGCTACASAWVAAPTLEPDGSHCDLFDSPCRGKVEAFLPERICSATATDLHRVEGQRDAAIWRCEAIASQAQKAVADAYHSDRIAGRSALRAYRAILRAESAEGILDATRTAPARTMRALIACAELLARFSKRRPCPSCRGPLDHRRLCRVMTLLARIHLLTEYRRPPQRIPTRRRQRKQTA